MAFTFNDPTNGGGGNFLPIITYSSQTGDWTAHNSENQGGEWVKSRPEIDLPFKVVIDFNNAENGWILISQGHVDMAMVKHGEPIPERPSVEHKFGFRFTLGNKSLGLRQFSHSALTVINEINKIHDQWLRERADNPGKIPVVEITKSVIIESKKNNGPLRFKAPQFEIVDWVDESAIEKLGGSSNSYDAPTPKAPPPPPKPLVEQDDDELF